MGSLLWIWIIHILLVKACYLHVMLCCGYKLTQW